MNLSTIVGMIGGGLPGSLRFVFSTISGCIVGLEVAPIITQNHSLCWGVHPHDMPHPEMPYSAPSCHQYHDE
eukprot:scaffold188422_cov122-Cyclotella_meneghiniana.AAC.1